MKLSNSKSNNSGALSSRLRIQVTLLLALASAHVVEMSRVVPIVKVVSDNVNELGEGPYFDAVNKVLFHVDATSGDFVRLDTTTGNVQKIHREGLVSMIVPYADDPNLFLVSNWNQVLRLNWTSGQSEVITTVSPETGRERFNDAKCDPRGRLFIGTVLEQEGGAVVPNGGALYRLDGNNLTQVARGFSISNGMAWSNDKNHTKMYFNDSEGRKIYSFDYDIETGTPSNQRVMIDCDQSQDFVAGEYPDGMAIDKFGYIWVAMYAGGRVVKIDVDTARVVDQVVLKPNVKVPSSLAPGVYQGEEGFFVTTAAIGISNADRLDDGKILHISFQGGDVYKYKP